MKALLKIAFKRHRALVLFALLSILFTTVASQAEMFAIGVMTNKQTGSASGTKVGAIVQWIEPYLPINEGMGILAGFLIGVALFRAVSLFFNRYLTRLVSIRVNRDLRGDYFTHLQKLPIPFFYEHNIGALSSRVVGDSSLIADAVSSCLTNYFQTPFVVLSSLALCFYTSWQLSLIIFLGFPAIVFPVVYLTKKVRAISRELQKNKEKFSSSLIDFLSGILTVKMFSMEDYSAKKFSVQNESMARLEQKGAKYDLLSRPVVHTIAMSFLSVSLMWGLYGLEMSIPDTLFFCGLLYIFYEPVKKFAEENNQIQRGLAAADRLLEIFTIQPESEKGGALVLQNLEDSIEFDNVTFAYDKAQVLNNLSFEIKKGEMVALVGPTGAGKSTIVHLLPRLWDVSSGAIRIDGMPLQAYSEKSLRNAIAFVPQKPFVFYDTIAENISFGSSFSRDEIIDAAKRAHAHEFIERMDQGYDTLLLEGGKSLSGGQLQRLAIARALIKKAPILVMDEATSSLDSVSEAQVRSAIQELRGEMTQIIIAHRLSTIENADRIFYIDRGRLLYQGTFDELLEISPEFRQMWDAFRLEKV